MTIEQQRDQWVRNEFVRCNNCEGDTSLDIRGAWDAGFLIAMKFALDADFMAFF